MTDFGRMRILIRKEERLRWAIEKQMARATKSTTSMTLSGGGGGSKTGSKVEDGAIMLAPLREEHRETQEELEELRMELRAGMAKVKRKARGMERTFIRMRYLQGISVRRIAEALNYSEEYVHRKIRATEVLIINAQRAAEEQKKKSDQVS